jgi:hypothetical protein
MLQTIHAVFDGKAFIPENGVALVEGKRYKLIIQPFDEGVTPDESAWDVLTRLIGTIEGPTDWASEIDHYLFLSSLPLITAKICATTYSPAPALRAVPNGSPLR